MMDTELKIVADFQVREVSGDKCLLCGKDYTEVDYNGVIFVGEGSNGRSVHGTCWTGFQLLCDRLGLDWCAAALRKRKEREARKPPLGNQPEWVK